MKAVKTITGWEKTCTKCKKVYPAPDIEGLSLFFYSAYGKANGLAMECKPCKKLRKQNKTKGNTPCVLKDSFTLRF